MNKVIILGTITKDIELKYLPSGSAIGSFGIAYNDRWKDQQGNPKDKAHFFDVTVFGKQAETVNNFFHKGSRILIEGSLDFQSWQDQQGQKRSKVGIKLTSFSFVAKKSDNQQGGYNNDGRTIEERGGNQAQQYKEPTQYAQQPTNQAKQLPEMDINEDEIPF